MIHNLAYILAILQGSVGIALSIGSLEAIELVSSFIDGYPTFKSNWPILLNAHPNVKARLLKKLSSQGLKMEHFEKLTYPKFGLIVNPNEADWSRNFQIDQEVYFLDQDKTLIEKYEVNDIEILQNIALIENGTLSPIQNLDTWQRRANFHGQNFISLVEQFVPYCIMNPSCNQANYLPDKKVYEVQPHTHFEGVSLDLMEIFQTKLNFTNTYFKPMVEAWGVPIFHDNGSIELAPGVIRELMENRADLVVPFIAFLADREQVISFSTPLGDSHFGIVVSNSAVQHDFDFMVYLRPFHGWAWLGVELSMFLACILMYLLWKKNTSNWAILGEIWYKIFQSQLGAGNFTFIWSKAKFSVKTFLFILLLVGNLFWLSYKASLTSSLAIPRLKLPFNDLKSLLATDYK